MPRKKNIEVPVPLERTRRRFEQWRRTRKARTRIPDSLWDAAVRMANQYGIWQTSKALRVAYYALKERVEKEANATSLRNGNQSKFIELPVASGIDTPQCTVELEDGAGAKMRVHLQGMEVPDLVALCRSFRGLEP
jgi:hypothetical protein